MQKESKQKVNTNTQRIILKKLETNKTNHMHDYECSEVTATAITYTLRIRLIRNSFQAEHPDDYMMHIKFEYIHLGLDAHAHTCEPNQQKDIPFDLYFDWKLLSREKSERKKKQIMKLASGEGLPRQNTHYRATSFWPCIFDAI